MHPSCQPPDLEHSTGQCAVADRLLGLTVCTCSPWSVSWATPSTRGDYCA